MHRSAQSQPDRDAAAQPPLMREDCTIDFYDSAGRWVERLLYDGEAQSVSLDLCQIAARLAAQRGGILLLRHSHPSQQAEPSAADIATTRALATLARLLGARLHDHVIETANGSFSFREAGLL